MQKTVSNMLPPSLFHCEIEMFLSCIIFLLDASVTDPLDTNLKNNMLTNLILSGMHSWSPEHWLGTTDVGCNFKCFT